jgi:hypothetical protein
LLIISKKAKGKAQMYPNNSVNQKDYGFVICGIDKITLGIDSCYLNYTKTPEQLKGIIDLVQWGNWIEINIQWSFNSVSNIDPNYPLWSVLYALYYAHLYNLFKEPLAKELINCLNGIREGYFDPYSFIYYFIETGIFKLDEYELFFDFYNYSPFFSFDKTKYKVIENTVYTPDFKRYKNKQGKTTGSKRSLLAYYDRAIKLGFTSNIKRLEFRICDIRAKIILTPNDLVCSLNYFIYIHGNQIKNILKRYIPPESITYDSDYIQTKAPNLSNLLWFLE